MILQSVLTHLHRLRSGVLCIPHISSVALPKKNIGWVKMTSHLMTSYYQWR